MQQLKYIKLVTLDRKSPPEKFRKKIGKRQSSFEKERPKNRHEESVLDTQFSDASLRACLKRQTDIFKIRKQYAVRKIILPTANCQLKKRGVNWYRRES